MALVAARTKKSKQPARVTSTPPARAPVASRRSTASSSSTAPLQSDAPRRVRAPVASIPTVPDSAPSGHSDAVRKPGGKRRSCPNIIISSDDETHPTTPISSKQKKRPADNSRELVNQFSADLKAARKVAKQPRSKVHAKKQLFPDAQ